MQPLDRSDPTMVGSITLRGRLGVDGMGRVFYGVTEDYEPVAVKVIRDDLAGRTEVRARFAREIEALRTVQGPYVATLIDASDDEDPRRWLAMEYIRGLSLKEYVESRGPFVHDWSIWRRRRQAQAQARRCHYQRRGHQPP